MVVTGLEGKCREYVGVFYERKDLNMKVEACLPYDSMTNRQTQILSPKVKETELGSDLNE